MSSGHLQIQGLAKTWPDGTRALEGIDIDLPAGNALVLLGTSGAGKSTLLRLIAGLEEPDAGRIVLDGRALVGEGRSVAPEQRGVGMVFQALELWPHLTVAEHIAFGLPGWVRGGSAREHPDVRRLARAVGLDESMLGRRPGTLSGGEQQRVAIARSLAPEPAVVLYDEPLANLDPARRASLRRLIKQLARERGTTIVYVTHDPQEALELGDEVVVLDDGEILQAGTPEELYRAPESYQAAVALGPVTGFLGRSDGHAVSCPLGTFERAVPPGPATLLWRPEALQVVGLDTPGIDTRGEVLECMLRGSDWLVTLHVLRADGTGMDVEAVADRAYERGAPVGLHVGPLLGAYALDLPAVPQKESA